MARNYRAEYQARVERRQDEAQSLGIKITSRQAAGHSKGGLSGADVRNAYILNNSRSDKAQQGAARRVAAKWNPKGVERGKRQGPKRSEIPKDLKKALGENWAQVVYAGYI